MLLYYTIFIIHFHSVIYFIPWKLPNLLTIPWWLYLSSFIPLFFFFGLFNWHFFYDFLIRLLTINYALYLTYYYVEKDYRNWNSWIIKFMKALKCYLCFTTPYLLNTLTQLLQECPVIQDHCSFNLMFLLYLTLFISSNYLSSFSFINTTLLHSLL